MTRQVYDPSDNTFSPATVPADELAYLKTYLGPDQGYSDDELTYALLSEKAAQARAIRIDPDMVVVYPSLLEALHRRCARALQMHRLPLGLTVDNDGGGLYIGRRDPEVTRLEAPYRRLVTG